MIKMKAYIHAINGAPWNEECAAALHGFQALGIPCVLFSSTDELADRAPGDVVVGGTLITEHALKEYGALPPNYSYPYELKDFYGREIRRIKLRNLNEEGFPVFVKPVKDKLAPGMVLQALDDIHNTEYSFLDPETEILCSIVVNFVSEWRCFVRYGTVIGLCHYRGDKEIACNSTVIQNAVSALQSNPAGFAIDFGVTDDGRTLVVEVNDGISLGCYGLQDILYAELLTARWDELTGTKDILKKR